jgi:energy-coupling factor transporter ATP-binding protein EcfA2
MDYVFNIFPRLQERVKQVAGTLSGGEQQMLSIGRALMSKPKFLMLDEPSLGIAPLLVKTIFQKIVEINRQQNITILLVEQNANLALEVSRYGYVLKPEESIEDQSAALRQNPQVGARIWGDLSGAGIEKLRRTTTSIIGLEIDPRLETLLNLHDFLVLHVLDMSIDEAHVDSSVVVTNFL